MREIDRWGERRCRFRRVRGGERTRGKVERRNSKIVENVHAPDRESNLNETKVLYRVTPPWFYLRAHGPQLTMYRTLSLFVSRCIGKRSLPSLFPTLLPLVLSLFLPFPPSPLIPSAGE